MLANIDRFEAILDSSWDQSKHPVAFGSHLSTANSHLGSQLLGETSLDGAHMELDGLQALGAKAVSMSIDFPILYRPFFSTAEEYERYLAFYRDVAAAVRARGLKLIIHSQILFAGEGGEGWNLRAFYDSLDVAQYRAGRAEMIRTIAQELQPDYLSVITEPDTEAGESGKAELGTPDGSLELLQAILGELRDAAVSGVKVGAGVGSWTPSYADFIHRFGATEVDFIDIHVYPAHRTYLDQAREIAGLARSYGKAVAMTETWAYKVRESELDHLPYNSILARDAFSFWAPVDARHLQMMVKFAHAERLDFFTPFWSGYFRAYLPYDETTKDLPPELLKAAARTAQSAAIVNAQVTQTGLTYHDAVANAPDLDPPSPPAAVTATTISDSSISIEWSSAADNVGALGYLLHRDGVEICRTAQRFYHDEGLDDGLTYTYSVTAFDLPGNLSPPSAAVEATTIDLTPPTVPAGLTAVAVSDQQVDLTWNPSTDNAAVDYYVIFRGTDANGMTPVATAEQASYSDTGVWRDTDFYYAVEAFDTTGHRSGLSATVTVRTMPDVQPPASPQNLIVQAVSDQQINLSWGASTDNTGVHGYKIYRGLAPGSLALVGYTPELSASHSPLKPSTTYYYQVTAVDLSGNESQPTPIGAATTQADQQPPTTPRNLVVQAVSDQQINLSWEAATDTNGVYGYKIYRGLTPEALALVGATSELSASHSPMKPATTYYYRVTAVDTSGNESQPTPIGAATTQADQQPPTTPRNLVVQAVSDRQINLSWEAATDSNGVYGYKIYRGLAPGSLVLVGYTPELSASHSPLKPATTYYYQVTAVDNSGNESQPTPIAAAATQADQQPPTAPRNLAVQAVSDQQINLSWEAATDSNGVHGYKIYRGLAPGALTLVGFTPELTASHSPLKPATTYYYQVTAVDLSGNESQPTPTAAATTQADQQPPTAPRNLVVQAVSDQQINLSWEAATDTNGVYGYKIYRGLAPDSLPLVGFTPGLAVSHSPLGPSTTYYYRVSAVDLSGNESAPTPVVAATTHASPDTAAPYVEMVLPANWATVRGTVVLAAFAYDYRKGTYDTPSGIASVRFQLDGANLGPELTVAPYTVAIDTKSLPNGPHVVTAVAVDRAGHAATSAPLTITVSN